MTEAQIREAIIHKLRATAGGRGAAFIAELHVDGFARRADLVVANGSLAAFEIKTSRDSLSRLPGQLQSYRRFFERVTVVCAQKHLDGVRAIADESVGVWAVMPSGRLEPVRAARSLGLADRNDWFTFLPVRELRSFARSQGLAAGGTRPELLATLAGQPQPRIRDFVLAFLKRRETHVEALRTKYSKTSPALDPVKEMQDAVRRYADSVRQAEPLIGIPRQVASKVV